MEALKCSIFHCLVCSVVATNKVKFSFHVDCFQIALFLQRCGSIMVYILGLNPPSFRCKKMKLSLNICYTMAKTKKEEMFSPFWKILKQMAKITIHNKKVFYTLDFLPAL